MTNKYLNCCTSVFNRKCITCVGGNCLVTLNELLKLYSTALIRTFIITYLKFIYLSVYFLQSKTDQLNNYCIECFILLLGILIYYRYLKYISKIFKKID